METFALNGGPINDWGLLAQVVFLPSSDVSTSFIVSERISVTMSGNASLSIDLLGDLSKVVNLGDGPVTAGFAVSGDLTKNAIAALGSADVSFALSLSGDITKNVISSIGSTPFDFGVDVTGGMSRMILGPASTSNVAFSQEGVLTLVSTLVGNSTMVVDTTCTIHAIKNLGSQGNSFGFDATGVINRGVFLSGSVSTEFSNPLTNLTVGVLKYMTGQTGFGIANTGKLIFTGGLLGELVTSVGTVGSLTLGYTIPIPASSADMDISVTGGIRSTQMFSGSADYSIEPVGTIHAYVYAGSIDASVTFDITGALANNAFGPDLESVLMVRPESQREMTR